MYLENLKCLKSILLGITILYVEREHKKDSISFIHTYAHNIVPIPYPNTRCIKQKQKFALKLITDRTHR